MTLSFPKKLLSCFLAAVMLFTAFAVSVHAQDENVGKYVKDVFIATGEDRAQAEAWLRNNGWEPLCDLNDGNVYGGAAQAYTLGINYWVNNNVKFQVNYQFNDNDRYANGKGKLFVGKDATTGKPTKDFTKIADKKAGVDYHMLCVRFEIDF